MRRPAAAEGDRVATRAERMASTSRDREEWAQNTATARAARANVAEQVAGLIVAGDIMGGRSRVAMALQAVASAEQRQDEDALRAAWMDVAAAAGGAAAALDLRL